MFAVLRSPVIFVPPSRKKLTYPAPPSTPPLIIVRCSGYPRTMLLALESTPGVSDSSVYTLRPTIGRLLISAPLVVRPICALLVLTRLASAGMVTSSVNQHVGNADS